MKNNIKLSLSPPRGNAAAHTRHHHHKAYFTAAALWRKQTKRRKMWCCSTHKRAENECETNILLLYCMWLCVCVSLSLWMKMVFFGASAMHTQWVKSKNQYGNKTGLVLIHPMYVGRVFGMYRHSNDFLLAANTHTHREMNFRSNIAMVLMLADVPFYSLCTLWETWFGINILHHLSLLLAYNRKKNFMFFSRCTWKRLTGWCIERIFRKMSQTRYWWYTHTNR